MKIAIIIGVEKYESKSFDNLSACKKDAAAIKAVIENVKNLEEILFLGENESASEIKRKISDLVEKYKGETLQELFFYFSGHGERFEDDFFYVLSDFDPRRKETTGLRNSELDDWIKTLSPKLCIKIIDACFSGTQYIKSEFNAEEELTKSAKKYGLNDVYFWFSSRDSESSYAGTEFSYFTESILTAISDLEGDVRYREIMAAVADDFADKGGPKPIFATQSDNIEKFGTITKQTHNIINKLFGFPDEQGNTEAAAKTPSPAPKEESIYTQIQKISTSTCYSEQTLISFINDFKKEVENWPNDVKKIYKVSLDSDLLPNEIPNISKIGEWLSQKTEDNYFATVTHGTKNYKVEEYKALPKKPPTKKDPFSLMGATLNTLSRLHAQEETEYKLESITKTKQYVNGFNYTHSTQNRILRLNFNPNLEIAPPISIYTISIYSNRSLSIHFSYEILQRKNWDEYSHPTCERWRTIKVNVNGKKPAEAAATHIKKEIIQWLETELKKRAE
ncbi:MULTISPECIES: caspase family protein [unclassified Pseudomonas]|uniref:caspase family protein n=1 Tax=unclassified Pseudomonas TaxID=196821 RepID=UPI0008E508B5|nr:MULTISPECIES: caspase family protein [unclassified Pseudomonas]PMV22067.1 caspase family protein [Pseudomonas sp. FW305-3-2-15-C-TSA2]PMV24169.1 caspase family protein [Pseudomonas sp. DP16D-L5]PMV37663.1 caspase family protein [Pseudomonas sp. FW305-3-2-15-A-LB2]PMV39787.1 caspase family protein [Pseudomonas sp. FW305-3-2-15-C-R2A1]PMV47887.1 caspase family protein [Pseudomonas sp. FW305-3-2-15-C-LB1]